MEILIYSLVSFIACLSAVYFSDLIVFLLFKEKKRSKVGYAVLYALVYTVAFVGAIYVFTVPLYDATFIAVGFAISYDCVIRMFGVDPYVKLK